MNPFVVGLLVMNAGASSVFAWQGRWAWALIYLGGGLIQAGCLWLTKGG